VKDLATEGDLFKRANLDLDVVPVFRNLLGQRGSLLHNDRGEPKHGKEGDQHCETHGCDPAHPQSAKPTDRRCQQKAQQHRKGNRDNNVASEVEECDDYPCSQDGQHQDEARKRVGTPQPCDRCDGSPSRWFHHDIAPRVETGRALPRSPATLLWSAKIASAATHRVFSSGVSNRQAHTR
jgi:hypothetical protein